MTEPIHIAQAKTPIYLLPKMANRHGLIAGATGTGKTVTLQTLAENFSARGVPVFMADVKGDLAGLSQPALSEFGKEVGWQLIGVIEVARHENQTEFIAVFEKALDLPSGSAEAKFAIK